MPASQPLYRDASSALPGMESRLEAARKRDVDKMMGQLKTVGDSVLGEELTETFDLFELNERVQVGSAYRQTTSK